MVHGRGMFKCATTAAILRPVQQLELTALLRSYHKGHVARHRALIRDWDWSQRGAALVGCIPAKHRRCFRCSACMLRLCQRRRPSSCRVQAGAGEQQQARQQQRVP